MVFNRFPLYVLPGPYVYLPGTQVFFIILSFRTCSHLSIDLLTFKHRLANSISGETVFSSKHPPKWGCLVFLVPWLDAQIYLRSPESSWAAFFLTWYTVPWFTGYVKSCLGFKLKRKSPIGEKKIWRPYRTLVNIFPPRYRCSGESSHLNISCSFALHRGQCEWKREPMVPLLSSAHCAAVT